MQIDINSTLVGMAALWIFAAVVNGMPAPGATSSLGYRWLYSSLQFLGSNLSRISTKSYPTSTVAVPTPIDKAKAVE